MKVGSKRGFWSLHLGNLGEAPQPETSFQTHLHTEENEICEDDHRDAGLSEFQAPSALSWHKQALRPKLSSAKNPPSS